MARWQRETPEAHQPFRQAKGDIEFTTDGTAVNTWEGWREMRLGIFSKRRRGQPAAPQEWDQRSLPAPDACVAFAAIEKSDRFGTRWGRWVRRLGIRDTSQVSVLADGARWIWEETAMHLAGATEVLDVFHALEKVAQTADVLYGEGSEPGKQWLDRGRTALLAGGWRGIHTHLVETKTTLRSTRAKLFLKT